MRFEGSVKKAGKWWEIRVPMLGVSTQGVTRKDAYEMVADAIEMLVEKDGFKVTVYPGKAGRFEVGSNDDKTLLAYYLRRLRVRNKVSLNQVAARMGSKSPNSFGRYEQGRSVPTMVKFGELLDAVSPGADFLLIERPSTDTR